MDGETIINTIILDSSVDPADWNAVWADEEPKDYYEIITERRKVEVDKGCVVNGETIATDRDGRFDIFSVAQSMSRNPTQTVRWRTRAGSEMSLDKAGVDSLANAVHNHVQACYDRELDLYQELKNGTFTESMIDTGWPTY